MFYFTHYLSAVDGELKEDFINCFGGSDTAHPSFSNLQKVQVEAFGNIPGIFLVDD